MALIVIGRATSTRVDVLGNVTLVYEEPLNNNDFNRGKSAENVPENEEAFVNRIASRFLQLEITSPLGWNSIGTSSSAQHSNLRNLRPVIVTFPSSPQGSRPRFPMLFA